MTRGQDGSLRLSCMTLSFTTPRRFYPGALSSLLETTMTPPDFLLLVVMILAQATAFADGGTVQLRKEAGPLVITVFSSPAPLSAGPGDISLIWRSRSGLVPVLDATDSLVLRADTSDTEILARPTRQQEQFKLLYAPTGTLTNCGRWVCAVTIPQNCDS